MIHVRNSQTVHFKYVQCFCYLAYVVLEMEPRASPVLGQRSISELYPSPSFVLIFSFETRSNLHGVTLNSTVVQVALNLFFSCFSLLRAVRLPFNNPLLFPVKEVCSLSLSSGILSASRLLLD